MLDERPDRITWFPAAVLWACLLGCLPNCLGQAVQESVEFNRDIRPLLSDNCFFCHGPDKQKSDLRLDRAESVMARKVVLPGQPDRSELIKRITSEDPDYRMPPPEANRILEPGEKARLRQWIQEGARFEKHWAFVPVPSLKTKHLEENHAAWSLNPIDDFVYYRLRQEGLEPSPPASRERWLRRVTLDLTGLPPSLEEVDEFLADTGTGAKDAVVDRLLASPAFGEQMAMPWLDVARYAETFGYDNDREMHMWPWRDWVIRAFNDNLPFDQFLTWQIAGDLLPDAGPDQVLATAFNRLHRQNAEGGVLPDEFLIEYVADRTQTFATAFLGLTLECARCHDHKFDPISQKDYYALTAYFNNIDEAGVYAEKTGATPTPNTFLYEGDQETHHHALKASVVRGELALEQEREKAKSRFDAWKSGRESALPEQPKALLHLSFDTRDKLPGSARLVPGRHGQAVLFNGDEGVKLGKTGTFERTEAFSVSTWLKPAQVRERLVVCHNSKPNWEVGSRGLEFILDKGHVEFGLSHFWPGDAIRIRSRVSLPPGQWTHVTVTYDGSSRARGIRLYLNGSPAESDVLRDHLIRSIRFSGNPPPFEIGARLSELGFREGSMDEFRLFGQCLSDLEVARLHDAEAMGDNALLEAHYVERVDEGVAQAWTRLKEARDAENAHVGKLRAIMVMKDKGTPALARVLDRGAYDRPGETVGANVPAAIFPPLSGQAANRRGLASWLVHRDHPLTARVAVNRIWSQFFGRGLVETLDDFGRQGSLPTHPELLDYLAARFMDTGWDVKALCKLVVTSATYGQDSGYRHDLADRDPDNLLLARGPRHRLRAEQIRDAALMASGLLENRVGGPSVKPYQPGGLWAEAGPQRYQADGGEKLYRRSLYTFWKRTVPPPAMLSFDAVSREVCVARRETTLTPSQALILLNDPQFVEAARVLAARVLSETGKDRRAGIEVIFRRLTGRFPRTDEKRELLSAYEEQHRLFSRGTAEAKAYTGVGAWPAETSLNAAELAAMTVVVQIVMNYHEFQMKM